MMVRRINAKERWKGSDSRKKPQNETDGVKDYENVENMLRRKKRKKWRSKENIKYRER